MIGRIIHFTGRRRAMFYSRRHQAWKLKVLSKEVSRKCEVSSNHSSRTAWSYFIYVLMSSRFEKLLSFSLCVLVAGWRFTLKSLGEAWDRRSSRVWIGRDTLWLVCCMYRTLFVDNHCMCGPRIGCGLTYGWNENTEWQLSLLGLIDLVMAIAILIVCW